MNARLFLFPILFPVFVFAQDFTVHEWGTFTTLSGSDGRRLAGLQIPAEPVPYFVYSIPRMHTEYGPDKYDRTYTYTDFKDVTVRMETPVIYFYSEAEKYVNVQVDFKNGSISEWFPKRSQGEPEYFIKTENFGIPRTGHIEWEVKVLKRNTHKLLSTGGPTNKQWEAARKTFSNIVAGTEQYWPNYYSNYGDTTGDKEKYLFYRGLGNFETPVKVKFNSAGNLIVENNFQEPIYTIVFEVNEDQSARIWYQSIVGSATAKRVLRMYKNSSSGEIEEMRASFVKELVKAGLFKEEAEAMLETWEDSYFRHPGLKIFWIAPRSYTDEVLPLKIVPVPDKIERVIVGRSEILTPEKEKEIRRTSIDKYSKNYYRESYKMLQQSSQPDYSNIDSDYLLNISGTQPLIENLAVFPNPANSYLELRALVMPLKKISITLTNTDGKLVYSETLQPVELDLHHRIDLKGLSVGLYILRIQDEKGLTKVLKTAKIE